MNLAERAVFDLFNGFPDSRKISVRYSGRFKGFNANATYNFKEVIFSLGKDWLEFSSDLQRGCIQSLAVKVYGIKADSFELDLYDKFIGNLPRFAKVDKSDVVLEESFNRINELYFDGLMNRPNLVWGQDAFSKLGHYEHQTDTVLVSNIFRGEDELLDYIMFHELLHKKHGMKRSKNGRAVHHSREFRLEEATYLDKNAEKKLRSFVRKKRVKNWLGF